MKILHFNTFDTGGAAQGSWRVHQALSAAGINSSYASLYISDNNKSLRKIKISQSIFFKIKYKLFQRLTPILYKSNHKYFTYNIIKNSLIDLIKSANPDIIHFHWIAQNRSHFIIPEKVIKIV